MNQQNSQVAKTADSNQAASGIRKANAQNVARHIIDRVLFESQANLASCFEIKINRPPRLSVAVDRGISDLFGSS
jgi:hypothetical protein